MRKFIRLWLMTKINYPDSYVQTSLKSVGVDWTTLSHSQIALYKSTLKSIEADCMIKMAYDKTSTVITQADVDAITNPAK